MNEDEKAIRIAAIRWLMEAGGCEPEEVEELLQEMEELMYG